MVFAEFVRVFGDAFELTEKCVQFGPVDIIFCEFSMLSRENVLILWSVLVFNGKRKGTAKLTSSKSANLSWQFSQ